MGVNDTELQRWLSFILAPPDRGFQRKARTNRIRRREVLRLLHPLEQAGAYRDRVSAEPHRHRHDDLQRQWRQAQFEGDWHWRQHVCGLELTDRHAVADIGPGGFAQKRQRDIFLLREATFARSDENGAVGQRNEARGNLGHGHLFPLPKHVCRKHEALRDIADLAVLVHRGLAQQGVGLVLAQSTRAHQEPLGLVDHLARLQSVARILQFALEPRIGVETAYRHVEDRLHSLAAQSVDHIGGYARLYGLFDGRSVRAVDEHRDRPLYRAGQLEHVLKHVPVRIFEIDDNDVRFQHGDLAGNAVTSVTTVTRS